MVAEHILYRLAKYCWREIAYIIQLGSLYNIPGQVKISAKNREIGFLVVEYDESLLDYMDWYYEESEF
jgi:hypothetical protein